LKIVGDLINFLAFRYSLARVHVMWCLRDIL